jgi:hypothetical protein
MVYLTMFVSELPVVATLTPDQKVYIRAEQSVLDEFKDFPAEKVSSYLLSLSEIISEDLRLPKTPLLADSPDAPPSIVAYTENTAKSTPPLASEDAPPDGEPSKDGS